MDRATKDGAAGPRIDDASVLDETWELDGAAWTQREPAHRPPKLIRPTLGSDSLRRQLLLFGGMHPDGTASGDTWGWEQGDWRKIDSDQRLDGRDALIAYDVRRQTVIMVVNTKEGTCEWNGGGWDARNARPGS